MPRLMATDPAARGGYPLDRDPSQVTDDGCPLCLDPAWRSDPERRDESAVEPAGGRDNLGDLETFDAPPADAPAASTDSHWRRLLDRVELRERWRAACERMVRWSDRGN